MPISNLLTRNDLHVWRRSFARSGGVNLATTQLLDCLRSGAKLD
jgi:hypothetical protein